MDWTRFRRFAAVVAIGAATISLGACGGDDNKTSSSSGGTATTVASGPRENVDMVPDGATWAFRPASITVAAGTPVVWKNKSNVQHNVVFDDTSVPPSDLFGENKTYTVSISKPGTYTYICTIHPNMKGEVIVQ